eukprot:4786699-Lingulodinium_polyedra.AAC.1
MRSRTRRPANSASSLTNSPAMALQLPPCRRSAAGRPSAAALDSTGTSAQRRIAATTAAA